MAMVGDKIPGYYEHPTFIDTWKDMEKLVRTGKVRSIGVSNFSIKTLNDLLPNCSIVPVINQVELHPYFPQDDLKAFCEKKGIILTTYSPLGRTKLALLEDPTIKSLANKYKTSPAQILINWGVQRGTVVVPKSEHKERILSNIKLVEIKDSDMTLTNNIHKQPGNHRSLYNKHDEDETTPGWTIEELGWNLDDDGYVTEEAV